MKRFTGIVSKVGSAKTAYVSIVTARMHPKYHKTSKVTATHSCHDEVGVSVGDEVLIVECRPMSATKFFRVDSIVKKTTTESDKPQKKASAAKTTSTKKKKKA